jgi:hypothetical protein
LNISRLHPSASVRCNNAPLIGECAAKRGRSATEGGDDRTGAKSAIRSQQWVHTNIPHRHASGGGRDQGCALSSMTCRPKWDDIHAGDSLTGNDAPFIGERAV